LDESLPNGLLVNLNEGSTNPFRQAERGEIFSYEFHATDFALYENDFGSTPADGLNAQVAGTRVKLKDSHPIPGFEHIKEGPLNLVGCGSHTRALVGLHSPASVFPANDSHEGSLTNGGPERRVKEQLKFWVLDDCKRILGN
jgi:hypothetical protein